MVGHFIFILVVLETLRFSYIKGRITFTVSPVVVE